MKPPLMMQPPVMKPASDDDSSQDDDGPERATLELAASATDLPSDHAALLAAALSPLVDPAAAEPASRGSSSPLFFSARESGTTA